MVASDDRVGAIDDLLEQARWAVRSLGSVNLHPAAGFSVREFKLKHGHCTADYML